MRAGKAGACVNPSRIYYRAKKGLGRFKNGRLLALAEPEFDLFLTCDRNLEYRQNLKGRKIGILLLSTNHWPTLRQQAALVQAALDKAIPGSFSTLISHAFSS